MAKIIFNPAHEEELQQFFDPKNDIKEAVSTDAVIMKDASGNKKWSTQHGINTVKQDFYSPEPTNQFSNSGFESGITGWTNKTIFAGDIRGQWGLEETTLTGGAEIDDESSNDADLQVVAGATSATGKILQGLTFNGTTQYLKQQIIDDQTGSSWGPTYHGLSLAATKAFLRVQGVDLSPWATAANDYMIVLSDGEGDKAWGYIDNADGAEALGSDLFDAGAGTFDSGTYSWVNLGTNTTENDAGTLKITYGNNGSGAYLYLRDSECLTSDLTVGKLYKLTFDAKVNTGSVNVRVAPSTGSEQQVTVTETNFTSKTIYFTSTPPELFVMGGMGAGEIIWLDNLILKEVTDVGTDGVHIMSTKGGSTQSWAGISASFNYNASAYTFEVRETEFQITGAISVGSWFNANGGAGPQTIIGKNIQDNGSRGYWLGLNASEQLYAYVSQSGDIATRQYFVGTSAVSTGAWHHVALVFNPSSDIKVYLDGVETAGALTGSAVASIFDNYRQFRIGLQDGTNAYGFSGTIDEPFVTAEALTADHILGMYNDIVKVNAWATSTNGAQSTTQKYAGTYSAKIIAGSSYRERLTQAINMGAVSVTLTAYCYTTGAAVTSADAQLWYDADVLSGVTYTDMGSGWYRLQKTWIADNASKAYGIVVEAGKTVYIDTVSLQAGTGATIEVTFENSSSGESNYTFEGNLTGDEFIGLLDGNS